MDITTENAKELASIEAERCITELQRGRAVALTNAHDGHNADHHIIRLIETITTTELEALLSQHKCQLVITRQRAAALEVLVDSHAACLELSAQTSANSVFDLAGLNPQYAQRSSERATVSNVNFVNQRLGLPAFHTPTPSTLTSANAAINLARYAHALPSFIMYKVQELPNGMLSTCANTAMAYSDAGGDLLALSSAHIPLATAERVKLSVFREKHGNAEHVAITVGEPDFSNIVTVRLHSSCFTGDILGSMKCDCGEQLQRAITTMANGEGGVVLYVSQEGRGIGLASKLLAYQLQDIGLDTIEANQQLGFDADERQYYAAVSMLENLGINRIHLMTNNPLKIDALRNHGIDVVSRMPSPATVNEHNARYLETKRERAGHLASRELHG